jgi:type VI secretion system protein ImpJ
MIEGNKVVWSEGLFLRTQHFQQQDRHAEALVRGALRGQPLPVFGFRSLTLDPAALSSGAIGLTAAEGLFPDGTPFLLAETTLPVDPLPVARDTPPGLVQLALPALTAGAATIDPHHGSPSGARYRGEFMRVRDTIRGGADAEEIEIARLAPRLLLPGQETGGYVTLPVARIQGLDAAGAVALDDGFLPPALVTSAAPWYAQFAQEIVNGLDRIAEAHGGMVLGGTGASVENLLILELANAGLPRIAHMLEQDSFHPAHLYLELAGLAGRMATYGSSSRRLTALPAYAHEDPQPAFEALADTLRSLILSLRHVEPKSRALLVARHSENVWTVRIDNPEIVRSSRIVLRVGGDMSEKMLRKLFVDQATVGSADAFDKLWTSRLPGIPLKPLHSQPREIPYDGERLCLELDRTSEHYASLADAPGFVVGVSGQLDREPVVDCYAVNR